MKLFYGCFIAVLSSLLPLPSDVASFDIDIEPDHIQIRPSSEIEVRCVTEPREPISACQFRIWYVTKREQGMLLNAPGNAGRTMTVSAPNPYDPGTNYTAELFGDNSEGACSVRFLNLKGDQLLVGCKVVLATKDFVMKFMSVFFDDSDNRLLLVANNARLVLHPGENVNVSVETNIERSLSGCKCTLPNDDTVSITSQEYAVNRISVSIGKKSLRTVFRPYESPYQAHCGFTIKNVQEEDSGVFFIFAHGDGRSIGGKAVTLIVTRRTPFRLEISFSKVAAEYDDGDIVTVTCKALGVRQTATGWNLWWEDTSTRQQRPVEPVRGQTVDNWKWPWQELSLSVTLNLTKRNHLKTLVCSTDGVAAYKLITIKQSVASHSSGEISTPLAASSSTASSEDATTLATLEIDAVGDDVVSVHSIFNFVFLVVLIVLITAGAIIYVKRKHRCCFKVEHMRPALEPVYDEINDELAARSLASYSKSPRSASIGLEKLMVPAEHAPKQPEEPEYIIPNAPDTCASKTQPQISQATRNAAQKGMQMELSKKLAKKHPVTQESLKQATPDDLEDPDGYLKPIICNKAKHV